MTELLTSSIAIGYGCYSIVKLELPKSFKKGLKLLFDCPKCYTFWMTLIVMQDLTLALLSSLVAFLLDSFIVTKL